METNDRCPSRSRGTFETPRDRATSPTTDATGVGFVFTDDDPIVGVDLDDCRIPETGKTREWASDIVDRLDSFTEISPSGTGYHVLVEGTLPEGRNRKDDVELYETARFFTVTGDHVEGTPTTVNERERALHAIHREYVSPADDSDESRSAESDTDAADGDATPAPTSASLSDAELLERAKNAANGEKFSRLWRGNTAGYESHSEADMALCSLLAFWTGGDVTQLDRLFRESGLMREKWDERHFADGSTYGEKTAERAIAGTSEFYEPSGDASAASAAADTTAPGDEERQTAPTGADIENLRDRETDRLERIEELETKLRETLDETERLRSALETERERRRELEAELEAEREDAGSESWLPWR